MFQAKLRSDILKGIVDVVSTLIDEAKFKIGDNGIQLKAVDPAHVAMIDLTLSKDAFEQYSAAETDLGLDLEKLKEVIRLSKSGDLIEMRQDEERGRLVDHGRQRHPPHEPGLHGRHERPQGPQSDPPGPHHRHRG
ncbi:MAG: hypothetical protein MZV70_43685 [Desulfobacterales bacterium]|nr:hypothetical protein [Desulfobacterales bacterium]